MPVIPNPYAYPPHSATVPVGAPIPQVYIDPAYQQAYHEAKSDYRRAKKRGTATARDRSQYKAMRANMKAMKGRGVVGMGLVNETVKGGKLASLSKLRRQF